MRPLLPTMMIAGATALAAGTSACSTAQKPDSGVRGLVKIGPTCPAERIDHPCPDALAAGATVTASGHSSTSDKHGRFLLRLKPGRYTVTVRSPSRWPFQSQAEVVVRPHRFTRVLLTLDSGIR